MRTTDLYRAIGLGGVVANKRKLNKVLRLASFEPDFSYERKKDKKGRIYFDRYKLLGSGFGVCVHGFRRTNINKEGLPIEKHIVSDWNIFAQGHEDSHITGAFMDSGRDKEIYCFTEEENTGNTFEFRLNNAMEMTDKLRTLNNYEDVVDFETAITKANVAMLMAYATVLLPVLKDEEAINFRSREDAAHKELLARARMGDAEAEETLQNRAIQQETDIRERLTKEDLLSVFEGYFLNLEEQSGIFSVLADIEDVEHITNEASMEQLYRLTASITGTKITMYIGENDLVGEPTPGMRIMGLGLLQGCLLPAEA